MKHRSLSRVQEKADVPLIHTKRFHMLEELLNSLTKEGQGLEIRVEDLSFTLHVQPSGESTLITESKTITSETTSDEPQGEPETTSQTAEMPSDEAPVDTEPNESDAEEEPTPTSKPEARADKTFEELFG